MTDICLVTWQRPEITYKVIKAIRKNTTSDYRLIIVDNGSPPEMTDNIESLLRHTNYLLIRNITNEGLEPARNEGLKHVQSEYFVCADSDCLPQPVKDGKDWLSKLKRLMDDNPEYGAIACRTQVMIGSGNIFDGHEDEEIVEFPHPGGSLRIMDTNAVRQVGGWRDDVKGRGQEERWICGQLNEFGYKTGFAVKVKTYHMFGDKNTDRWGYDKKWKPEDSGHSDIWHPALAGDDPLEVAKYA